MFIIYATKGYLFFLYKPVSQSCKRQPADESTEYFTKYCINQIEIAYVVIFGTTLLVGIASAFYIARFKTEMIALIISIPNFRVDFISYLNNDGLLSQVRFGNNASQSGFSINLTISLRISPDHQTPGKLIRITKKLERLNKTMNNTI